MTDKEFWKMSIADHVGELMCESIEYYKEQNDNILTPQEYCDIVVNTAQEYMLRFLKRENSNCSK